MTATEHPASSLGGVVATLTRLGYVAFLVVLLTWIGKLPSPWFTREADDVVSFNYHPLAMGLAFVVLMPEALLAYADLEERKGVSHATAKQIHAALNGGKGGREGEKNKGTREQGREEGARALDACCVINFIIFTLRVGAFALSLQKTTATSL